MQAPWPDFEQVGQALQRATWRVATTMPKNPHAYTLIENWEHESIGFNDVGAFINAFGYNFQFGNRTYRQLNVNEYFYWTMEAYSGSLLINRKPKVTGQHPYDAIAARYDILFRDPESVAVQRAVIDGYVPPPSRDHGASTLDIGCGTGMFLRHRRPAPYVGIDPSSGMLREFRHHYPDVATITTTLADFCPSPHSPRFKSILALFGTASYLSDAELARIPSLLAEGGTAVLMWYREGHPPAAHSEPAPGPAFRYWTEQSGRQSAILGRRYVLEVIHGE